MPGPIHILSFDNPYPPSYGGVIDVYYKIAALQQRGFEIYLHCFVTEIPTSASTELQLITKKIFFYKKRRNFMDFLSLRPYSVQVRRRSELLQNLKSVEAPVLFESLKLAGVLNDVKAFGRKTILRLHNIESDYFLGLAKSETNLIKKMAYWSEGLKFRNYESIVKQFDVVSALSLHENQQVQKLNKKSYYIPLFHGNKAVANLSGFGKYAIYSADLKTPDNRRTAVFLIDIFKETRQEFIIAASSGEEFIKPLISKYRNIRFIKIRNYGHLQELLASAHINVMFSFQRSGSKLKAINGLFNSRHCLINENMIDDPKLLELCHIANNREEMILKLKELQHIPYSDFEKRKAILEEVLSDSKNAEQLERLISD